MDLNTFYYWLEMANRQGANGKRLIDVSERKDMTASESEKNRYILSFDDGPESAADKPWP